MGSFSFGFLPVPLGSFIFFRVPSGSFRFLWVRGSLEFLGFLGVPWGFLGVPWGLGISWDSLGLLGVPWGSLGFLGVPYIGFAGRVGLNGYSVLFFLHD